MTERIAVVLFNLGGPDQLRSVRPFLFNLFNDPAILRVPNFVRAPLAYLISFLRTSKAQKIYAQLGGGSPLLANMTAQAEALEQALQDIGQVRVWPCMRYWHPMAGEVAAQVKDFNPHQVILLPLYPQFSSTTTASSLTAWRLAANLVGLLVPTLTLCCYPTLGGFIKACTGRIRPIYDDATTHGRPRLLFSAHGLPKKIVADGDPYQWQCEQTAKAIVAELNIPELDWACSYQSRVGPLEWIGPSTESEIKRAASDHVPLVIFPTAFTSDNSETLVEIEQDYRKQALTEGVPYFARVDTVGAAASFIAGLANLIRGSMRKGENLQTDGPAPLCPHEYQNCPHHTGLN